ncbi:MAG: SDR family NAD(P)-dependent oxidoreductase [Xanthomonadales bacterium]|nr:SDR family NAD(P)-dependent oxidoreductase [Xanthomonadales bacterium]
MLPTLRPEGDAPAPAAGSLAGRVVLVSGATGGLGRATALAAAAAGASVVLLGRKVRPLEKLYDEITQAGFPQPALYPMDLAGATPKDHADLAASIGRELGRLDGLVHAAAHFDTLQPFEQQTPEEWQRTQQVNLTAPFLLTAACLPLMKQGGDAAVVFVFDDVARVGNAFWGGYGVAKHALLGLASIVHEETENSPVRTHAVLPPPMRTALRRAAYYGENTMEHPDPAHAAAAIAWLLGTEGAGARGKVLDLRG